MNLDTHGLYPIFLETISPPRGSSLLAFLIIGNAIASVMANFIKKIITFSYELEMWWFLFVMVSKLQYKSNSTIRTPFETHLIYVVPFRLNNIKTSNMHSKNSFPNTNQISANRW